MQNEALHSKHHKHVSKAHICLALQTLLLFFHELVYISVPDRSVVNTVSHGVKEEKHIERV